MIDLHTHTTASDGSCAPAGLVRLAKQAGLTALGVTDHDTVDGLEEAVAAAGAEGLDLVPGIEISVDYPGGEFHLLGYYVNFRDPEFLARLRFLQNSRRDRNQLMVRRMQELGMDVTLEEIVAEADGGQVGRPHMARVLVRKGYASSIQDAFDRLLADGRPLHIPKVKLSPEEAIALVRRAAGVPVLAHPKFLEGSPEELERLLERCRDAGLEGLECFYSQHTEAETARYLDLARRLGLLVTAGSDFHGDTKPHVPLGVIYRGGAGDPSLLAALKRAAGRA